MSASNLFLFAILGLAPGALIAGLGIGVVLQYRGSGTIDVSIGAVAMYGGYVFYGLHGAGELFLPIPFVPLIHLGGTWGTWPALIATAALCGLLGAAVSMGIFARLRTSSAVAKLVAALGILVLLQAMVLLNFGSDGEAAYNVLPNSTVSMFNAQVPVAQLVVAAIIVAVAIVLALVYRFSRFGLATRAAAENEAAATLAGLSPNPLALVNTVAAYVVAGMLGVLVAPTTSLDPTTLVLAVIPALGAALLARFTSFWVVLAAGLVMGAIESEFVLFQGQSWFPTPGGNPLTGVSYMIFFIIIIVALLLRGSGLPTRGALIEHRLPPAPRPKRILRPTLLIVSVCVVGFLFLSYDYRQALIAMIIAAIVNLSFVVVTGYVGQVSLLQTALAGTSGFVIARVSLDAHINFPLGALMGIAAAVIVGVLTTLPALRIRGVNLVIVSLAAAVALENFGFDNNTWGDTGNQSYVSAPKLFGINLGPHGSFPGWNGDPPSPTFGLVCLLVAVVIGVLVALLRRGLLGQRMLAIRSNERAAAAVGISGRNTKIGAFAISSAIAGCAGALYAYDFGAVSVATFTITVALGTLAFAYMGGITTVSGALFGASFAYGAVPAHALEAWTSYPLEYQSLIGGIGLLFVVLFRPEGIALAHTSGTAPHNYIIRWISWPVRRAYRQLRAGGVGVR